MDVLALAMAKADAAKRYARPPVGVFGGLSVLTDRSNGFGNQGVSNGTDTMSEYRRAHRVLRSGSDLRLLFANTTLAADGLNDITVKVSVEPGTVGKTSDTATAVANIYPVTFNGADSVLIRAGGWALSDPIPMSVTAAQWIYTRTNVSVASAGMKWPVGLAANSNSGLDARSEGHVVGSDARFSTSNVHTVAGAGYSPIAILGTPLSRLWVPTVGIIGDSIDYGSGEYDTDFGFGVRICTAASTGYVQAGVPGDQLTTMLATNTALRARMGLVAGCSHVMEGLGTNDANASRTTAQLTADKLNLWTRLANRGIKVRTRTLTPRTSSTDSWTTLGNQTVNTGQTTRDGYNAWIRDGAPIDATSLAYVAPGTNTNVLRAGQSGHPLNSWYDAAAAVESAPYSGLWKLPERVVTDGHWSASSAHVLSSTANFTSADIGKTIVVRGAGAAAADYFAVITTIVSASDATVAGAGFSTAVASGGTVAIGTPCADGLHPSTSGHVAIAAANPYTFT